MQICITINCPADMPRGCGGLNSLSCCHVSRATYPSTKFISDLIVDAKALILNHGSAIQICKPVSHPRQLAVESWYHMEPARQRPYMNENYVDIYDF